MAELSAGIKISISGSVTQKVTAGSIMQIIQTGTRVTTSKIWNVDGIESDEELSQQ